jgi:hypothetical protein
MSAHQMVCHLGDGFRMALGEKPSRPVAGRLPRPVMRWIALYLPLPWPEGIQTTPEINQEKDGTCPTGFGADVARLESLVEALTSSDLEGREHPVFGRMSRAAWLRWGYLHMDHHLRQFGA